MDSRTAFRGLAWLDSHMKEADFAGPIRLAMRWDSQRTASEWTPMCQEWPGANDSSASKMLPLLLCSAGQKIMRPWRDNHS
jgi:hypothetical protein